MEFENIKTEVKNIWIHELEIFEKEYQKYKKERDQLNTVTTTVVSKTVKRKKDKV